ncbi:hypothetical protein QYM36_000384, partial [Artemia franciscana]
MPSKARQLKQKMKRKYDEEKQEISEIRRKYYQENKDRIKEDVKSRFQTNEMAKERNQTKALKRHSKLYAASQDYRSRKNQVKLTQYNNHKDKFSQLFGDYYKRNRDILTAKLWVRKEMKNGTPTPLSRTKHGKNGNKAPPAAEATSISFSACYCPRTERQESAAFKKAVEHRMKNDAILSQRSRVKQKRHRQYYLGKARKVQKMQNDLKEMQQVLNMHYCNTEDSKEAIKLEFARANNVIEMATNSLAKRHALNAAKCEKFLDNLPEDEPPTLEDFTTAMGNLRQHSEYTEPYFYETAYTNYGTNICRVCNSFSDNVYTVIPIDEEGSARFFQQSETETPVRPKQKCSCLPPSCAPGRATPQQTKPSRIHDAWKQFPSPSSRLESQSSQVSQTRSLPDWNLPPSFRFQESQCSQTQDDDLSSEDENEKYIPPRKEKKNTKKDDNDDDEDVIPVTVRWECHEDLCKFNLDDIYACQHFFSRMEQTKTDQLPTNALIPFYLESLDACKNPLRRTDKLGHSPFCAIDTGCYSFLRPMRALKPHFPVLNRFVCDIYKAIVRCKIIVKLNMLKAKGTLKQLQKAVKKAITSLQERGKADESM